MHHPRVAPLLACALLVACTVEDEPSIDADDAAETEDVFRAGAALPPSMASSLASLQNTATQGKAFVPKRLIEVANDYALRYQGVPRGTPPLGVTYLKDAEGNVTAMSVTYALVDDLSYPTAEGLQTWINAQSAAIASSLKDGLPVREIAELRIPDEYVNVIIGASPRQPRLLSLTRGLPVQVYEQLGRRRIAAELGVPLASVSGGVAFFEPTMDRASRLGLRYQVTGKGPHLFFVPDSGTLKGLVVPVQAFAEVRTTANAAYRQTLAKSMKQPLSTPLPQLLETKHAEQWGRTFALMDAIAGAARPYPCPNCSAFSATRFESGVFDVHQHLFDFNDECDCVASYQDGSEYIVNDCENVECCQLENGELPEDENCLIECVCECEAQIWETFHYDQLLRGVPNLFQQQVTVPWSPICDSQVAVGCGAVVAAELAVYYDTLGHDELLDHHHDTQGRFLWQDLTEELRNDWLDSHCWDGVTWTLPQDLAKGIFDYFWAQGVPVAVVRDPIDVVEEVSAFDTIEDEITANRPLILGFNSNAGNALGQGLLNHYALIAGHSTTVGTREIHLSMGWGLGTNEVMEWDLVGQVQLYTVNPPDAPTGNEECMADTPLADPFAEDPHLLDWVASEEKYDDYPIAAHLTGSGDPHCDRIGGVTQGWFDSHWTERMHCITPHDIDVLEQHYQEFNEELNDGDIPDWIWE